MIRIIALIFSVAIAMFVLTACGPADPTATIEPSPTAMPEPTLTPEPPATLEPTPTPTPTSDPTPTPIPDPEPTAPMTLAPGPTPLATRAPVVTVVPVVTQEPTAVPEWFDLALSEASLDPPNSITFSMEGMGEQPIEVIDLEFGTESVFSCASNSYTSARTDFEGEREVSTTWTWDMRRTGSIPPGSVVWWRWRVVDDQGQELRTPRQSVVYGDDRFSWQSHTSDNITFHWYAGGPDFGQRLARAVGDRLDVLQLGRELEAPVQAFIYESSADVREAVLFTQAWVGGLAFPSQNILLNTVDPEEFEDDLRIVAHELAHLLVGEVTFNCFGDLPRWLDEGLAVYAEGGLPDFQRVALQEAIDNRELISLRSLNSSFPASDTGATLSYALSYSLVNYMIDAYGWTKMQELLAVFSEGSTYEAAVERVYGLDLDSLEEAWHSSLGLE